MGEIKTFSNNHHSCSFIISGESNMTVSDLVVFAVTAVVVQKQILFLTELIVWRSFSVLKLACCRKEESRGRANS